MFLKLDTWKIAVSLFILKISTSEFEQSLILWL